MRGKTGPLAVPALFLAPFWGAPRFCPPAGPLSAPFSLSVIFLTRLGHAPALQASELLPPAAVALFLSFFLSSSLRALILHKAFSAQSPVVWLSQAVFDLFTVIQCCIPLWFKKVLTKTYVSYKCLPSLMRRLNFYKMEISFFGSDLFMSLIQIFSFEEMILKKLS